MQLLTAVQPGRGTTGRDALFVPTALSLDGRFAESGAACFEKAEDRCLVFASWEALPHCWEHNAQQAMILRAALLAPCRASAGRCCSARLVRALAHNSRQRVMAAAAARDVRLTDQEKELFSVLRAVVEHACPQTVLRCAGGWVRDKLLGKESHDIDIALSDKKGVEFAEDVNKYLASQAQSALKVARTRRALPAERPPPGPHQAPAPRRTPASAHSAPGRAPGRPPTPDCYVPRALALLAKGSAWRPWPQPCLPWSQPVAPSKVLA